jgi:hypothetical protein
MGLDYGELMKNEITNHENYVFSNLSQFGVTQEVLNTTWDLQKDSIDERIEQELNGMAESTGISYDTLGKLQLVELLSRYTTTKCSGSLLWSDAIGGSEPLIQTYSLNRQLFSSGQQNYPVVIFYIPDEGFPHAIFTFAGMVVGRAGVNVAGLTYGDIPVFEDNPENAVLKENMLIAFRSALYDLNRLNAMAEWVEESTYYRWHTYLLGDCIYESRGAKYTIKPDLIIFIRYNDDNDNYYPNVLSKVVYDADTPERAMSIFDYIDYIETNYEQFDVTHLYTLSQQGAIPGSNLMNLVIDATSLIGYVAVANEDDNGTLNDASTQEFIKYNFQSTLP